MDGQIPYKHISSEPRNFTQMEKPHIQQNRKNRKIHETRTKHHKKLNEKYRMKL